MLNTRTLVKLILLTLMAAALVVAVIMYARQAIITDHNVVFFPNLLKQPQVSRLILQDHEQTLTLQRNDNIWVIVERNNYPVLPHKVEQLMAAMSKLRIIEPKTTNEKLYSQLDLDPIKKQNSKALQVTLQDAAQNDVVNVLIGKREGMSLGDDYVEQIFVRNVLETQSWLVQGLLPLSNALKDWVEQPLLGIIEPSDLKQIQLQRPNAEMIRIAKTTPQQEDFVLEGVAPQPGTTLDPDAINALPFEIAEIEFNDVVASTSQNLDWSTSIQAQIETFSGVTIALDLVRHNGTVYSKVHASASEAATPELRDKVLAFNNSKQAWYYLLPGEFYKDVNVTSHVESLVVAE